MACRVGMSTDPHARIAHWKRVEGYRNSRILASNLTYDRALARELVEANKRGCKRAPGGRRNGLRNWSVYYVWG